MALAYEAGAELMDMEFVQFHPTLVWAGSTTATSVPGGGYILQLHDNVGRRFEMSKRRRRAPHGASPARCDAREPTTLEVKESAHEQRRLRTFPVRSVSAQAARSIPVLAGTLRYA